jgi:hypothetical protein
MGVDFFEGPYQDEDEIDNPLTSDIQLANDQKGIPYKGIGIGYGDGIVDNERFGMRKFLYHNSGISLNGPPQQAVHYYNYLRGFWKNGQRMAYGGNALTASSGANLSIEADYMFPGDTDPYHFGTGGVITEPWTEVSSGNPPADRRFMQTDFDDVEHALGMLKAAVELGGALGLRVVAEGIESREEFDAARQVGCDYAQGYFIGRPVRAESFGVLVVAWEVANEGTATG